MLAKNVRIPCLGLAIYADSSGHALFSPPYPVPLIIEKFSSSSSSSWLVCSTFIPNVSHRNESSKMDKKRLKGVRLTPIPTYFEEGNDAKKRKEVWGFLLVVKIAPWPPILTGLKMKVFFLSFLRLRHF